MLININGLNFWHHRWFVMLLIHCDQIVDYCVFFPQNSSRNQPNGMKAISWLLLNEWSTWIDKHAIRVKRNVDQHQWFEFDMYSIKKEKNCCTQMCQFCNGISNTTGTLTITVISFINSLFMMAWELWDREKEEKGGNLKEIMIYLY